jgi:predicted Zn-ribbon and HTH transcriptional regulator
LSGEENFLTTREKIYLILKNSPIPLTVEDIINMLGYSVREKRKVEEDIEHLALSLKSRSNGKERIAILPARCLNCGYTFKDNRKAKRPSKCPKCKSFRIEGPWFYITESSSSMKGSILL